MWSFLQVAQCEISTSALTFRTDVSKFLHPFRRAGHVVGKGGNDQCYLPDSDKYFLKYYIFINIYILIFIDYISALLKFSVENGLFSVEISNQMQANTF